MLLMSCGPSGTSFRIEGKFRDMEGGELYIYNLSDNNARLDTLQVKNGKFIYRGQAEETTPYILVFPNGVEQVIFVSPASDLKYEATANDLKNYVVNGSEENKLMNQFRQETYTLKPSKVISKAASYIKQNPTSPVAIYLLDQYFVQDEEVNEKELSQLLKLLRQQHPHNLYLLEVESKLKSASRSQVGMKLPNVTLLAKDKSKKNLWSPKKEKDYHLITFWATWMENGYDFLWKLRKSNDNYKDGGKLRIVAVSLDIERYRWEEATRPDTTSIIEHYCDGMSFESKAIKQLGIEVLPYYILTDKEHKVLEKGADIKQMEEKLKKHLEEKKSQSPQSP